MDGLLLDTEGTYRRAWSEAAAQLGFDLDDALFRQLIGITIADCERVLSAHFGAKFPLDVFRRDGRRQYEALVAEEGIPLKPGVRELLDWADRQAIPAGIGTSTVTEEASAHIEKHGLRERFRVLVGGDQVTHGKPDPEIFLKVAAGLGVEPARGLVLEDAHSGVRAAHAGGFHVVLVPDLLPPTPEISDLCAGVFVSLTQVRDWLETSTSSSSK